MTRFIEKKKQSYFFGILLSALSHVFLAVFLLIFFHEKSSGVVRNRTVYSVTLEGGEALGGVDLAPLDPDFKSKVVPNFKNIKSGIEIPEVSKENKVLTTESRKLTGPSVVDDPEYFKKLEDKKARELAEIKRLELEKKKKEEEKKRQEDLKRKKEAEEKQKKERERKKAEEEARKKKEADQKKAQEEALKKKQAAEQAAKKQEEDLNNRLNNAKKAAMERYSGESVNAGGEGIGAARLGGQGFGGGEIVSIEKRRYDILLEDHVHRGWRWLSGREPLMTSVQIRMLPNGVINSANIISSSGNSNFDEAVLRAVYKASPLPPPPQSLYEQHYKVVVFTFKSNE